MTEGFTWQALNALAHFFKYVCGVEDPVFGVKLKKTGTRVPVVLSKPETQQLIEEVGKQEEKAKSGKEKDQEVAHGRYELAARLQYGAGLRLSELVRLRVQDMDVGRGTVTVRQGKGDKDRVTLLPTSLWEEVARQIERVRQVWQDDRAAGLAGVRLPGALARKFRRAAESFEWSRKGLCPRDSFGCFRRGCFRWIQRAGFNGAITCSDQFIMRRSSARRKLAGSRSG